MKDRRMHIGDIVRMFDRMEADLVGSAMHDPP